MFTIIPAIDIRGGKVVRLKQGDYRQETVYHDDPVAMARHWETEGAQWLHVVDLDGAREGKSVNLDLVAAIAEAIAIPVELGGGIRNINTVEEAVNKGIARVIIGTKAVTSPDFVREACCKFGGKIIVGIDARDGLVSVEGWTSSTSHRAVDFAKEMETLGVKRIIFTDIKNDGMLSGPNLEALDEMLREITIPIIASGGVSCIEDIKSLKNMEAQGLEGAIVGKALYDGRINLKEAIKGLRDI